MRYLNILLLQSQHVFQERSRALVWFITSFLQPLLLIAMWTVAFKSHPSLDNWTIHSITSYYLLLGILATLMPWVEETVCKEDILEGKLTQYLLKPLSYYWFKFYEEMPYRILQVFYAIVVVSFILLSLKIPLIPLTSAPTVILSLLIVVLSYFLSFNYKIIVGLLAFWFVEVSGLLNFTATVMMLFAGYVMPLDLLPPWFATITRFTPFPYMIYYPVIALQGKLNTLQLLEVMSIQIFWIVLLAFVYKITWKKGVRLFTSFGQ